MNTNQWEQIASQRKLATAYAALNSIMRSIPNTSHRDLHVDDYPSEVIDLFRGAGYIYRSGNKLVLTPDASNKICKAYHLGQNEVSAVIDLLNAPRFAIKRLSVQEAVEA